MVKIVIDASELRKKADGETIKELEEFLKEKLGKEVSFAGDEATIEDEGIKKTHLKVILKKFLHQTGLKEDFRLISMGNNTFMFKERKIYIPPEE